MINFEVINLQIEKIKSKYFLKINDIITRNEFKKELTTFLNYDVICNDINNDDFILSNRCLIASFIIDEDVYHIIVCNNINKFSILSHLETIDWSKIK